MENIKKYNTLEEIETLDISSDLLEKCKNIYNKIVYYESGESCNVGIMIGIGKTSQYYYIIKDIENESISLVPIYNSLTLLYNN